MDFRIKNGVLVKYKGKDSNVVIPNGVTSIGKSAFSGCILRKVKIPNGVTSIGESAFSGCYLVDGVTIPNSVTSIGESAFSGCESLKSIVIPDSVTSIGKSAFSGCERLMNIVIPDSVTSIGDLAFYHCSNLKRVTISDGVTSIGNSAFSFCRSLTSVTIPDSVTSIGNAAFYGCWGLMDDSGLVIIRHVLYCCEIGATSVSIPDDVTSIGDWAFNGCKKLKNVMIPNSVTSIGDGAFCGCDGLTNDSGLVIIQNVLYHCKEKTTSVTIPNNVTSIEDSAFSGCKKLTSVTIPDGVTSIGGSAFYGCKSLTCVTIPDSVTSIGEEVFFECKNLKDFTCPSTFAKELQYILPKTKMPIIIHIPDISGVSAKFRPGAAVGFAEDNRDCADENGKKYAKYIKANAAKLVGLAIEHPALLYLMLREKLIAAKDLEAVTNAVQESGNTELMAAMLEYGNSSVSEKDKAKAKAKKEERETNVTSFVFDAEKLEALSGKTFVVTGKLKTFVSRDELKECLTTCGATLTETLAEGVDYLITNTPNSGTAKNKKAVELGIKRITEDEFNEMIGRSVQK